MYVENCCCPLPGWYVMCALWPGHSLAFDTCTHCAWHVNKINPPPPQNNIKTISAKPFSKSLRKWMPIAIVSHKIFHCAGK